MVGFLLDTCVVVELQRPHGNADVRARVEEIERDQVMVSVITIGELAKGLAKLAAGRHQREVAEWLLGFEQRFATRVLPVDIDVARRWGELTARAQASGIQVPVTDGFIAATALQHGLHVMTRNSRHFTFSGVTVIDPWEG